jgi:hypothetical protein
VESNKLNEKPKKDWSDAVLRLCSESQHKKSLCCDKSNFKWLDQHLDAFTLEGITRDRIERIALIKEKEGANSATVNRVLARKY